VTLESAAVKKGLCLQMEGARILPEVLHGDPERLTEIFTDLIGNAVKYTEKGEVEVSICMLITTIGR